MRTTKKIVSSVLAVCMLASTSAISAFAAQADEEVGATPNPYLVAVEALDAEYTYTGNDLGAVYSPEQTVFKVWSPTATEVTLNRFATGSDSEEGAENLGTVAMEKLMKGDGSWTGVWTATVTGDIVDTYYTYTIKCIHPKSGAAQTAETQDVYSVATGVNGRRSMVCDLSKTNPDGWENDTHVVPEKQTDSTVWELHVKDFSWDPASGVSEENRGKFLAFTENGTTLNGEGELATCIDYLKELGVTTVQLNPFYDFQSINEAGSNTQFNWGYDPQNYNVPEGSYSSNPYDGNVRIRECKAMIQALHNAGISVVMDVVYNHTFSNSKDDSCFQATVPDYYYRMTKTGAFSNGSGVGNEVSSERAMTRKYIIDSIMHWVNEYHVDGFRFDLMGLMDTETLNLIRQAMDEVDTRLTTWGEGWTGGTSTYPGTTCTGAKYYQGVQKNAKELNSRVAFFNDVVRNGIKGTVFDITEKGYIAGNAEYAKNVRSGVRANTTEAQGWTALAPEQCVTYADCHDNATIYDQIAASYTKDEYGVRNDKAVKVNKFAAGILYTSQGVTFTLAGEEMGRTKYGDTNSYKSSPEINKIQWQNLVDYADLISYYKGMMKIKKAFSPLRAADNSYADKFSFYGKATDMIGYLAYTITNDRPGEWNKMAVIHNSTERTQNVTLKDDTVGTDFEWVVIAKGDIAGVTSLGTVTGKKFSVPPQSTLVAVDKAGYEAAGITENTGRVVVDYKYKDGTKLADSAVLYGEIGKYYVASPSASVNNTYEVQSVEGNVNGVYTEEEQHVTYVYGDYIPENIRNFADINQDGSITLDDVTEFQRILAEFREAPAGYNLDFDGDGVVSINDATMLQKYLAEYRVSEGTVIINYYYDDADGTQKKLTDTITINGRVGDPFTSEQYYVMGYQLDESRLPKKTEGTIPYGKPLYVNYYYIQGSPAVSLHFKHSGALTWAPTLWIWGSGLDGKDSSFNATGGTWPGRAATKNEATGWYDYNFDYEGAGTYNVIVSNSGKNQTADCKGFGYNEMWCVIDDSKIEGGNYVTFYDADPDTNPDAKVIPFHN